MYSKCDDVLCWFMFYYIFSLSIFACKLFLVRRTAVVTSSYFHCIVVTSLYSWMKIQMKEWWKNAVFHKICSTFRHVIIASLCNVASASPSNTAVEIDSSMIQCFWINQLNKWMSPKMPSIVLYSALFEGTAVCSGVWNHINIQNCEWLYSGRYTCMHTQNTARDWEHWS